ncbi:unnamed protein product [Angiostrongylus costaricensis]|uniref:Endo/exonuclease/phosphatase domain-containing protein n=1 Tax=Angiostrongylus costaricensis TaxID=334426 RepID=A0A0R3PNT2_ANGCS|nr:unnamed protein product [Angiostrongylus costaricensis]
MVRICTYNARILASESSIEVLLMQARRIKYDVIGLAETRRRQPFNAIYDTGKELFLGTCNNRGVGSVGVLVNTSLSMNTDSQLMWINSGFDNPRRLRAEIKL